MKLTIFAILLLVGSIPNMTNPENLYYGVLGALIGALILGFKIFKSAHTSRNQNDSDTSSHYSVNTSHSHLNTAFVSCKTCGKPISASESEDRGGLCNNCWGAKHDELERHDSIHKSVVQKHYALNSEIRKAQSLAFAAKDPFSPLWDSVIALCKSDISIASIYKDWFVSQHALEVQLGYRDSSDFLMPAYPSFVILSRIYEKQNKYNDAISICQQAVALGFLDDGTKSQMPGRIERLMRKKDQIAKKNKSTDDVVDCMGEVVDIE